LTQYSAWLEFMVHRGSSLCILIAAVTIPCFSDSEAVAQKFYPDHPVVQDMVNKGMAFLQTGGGGGRGNGFGGEGPALVVGLCAFKVTGDPEHPLVKAGVAQALELAHAVSLPSFRPEEKSTYIMSVAGMLLPSVNVDTYGQPTKQIRDYLLRIQKPNGGFGYTAGGNDKFGDISQTQYVMLAFWTMNQTGIEVPNDAVIRTLNFLLLAQEQPGGWPYMHDGGTATQGSVTNSLTAAGLSALLIGGDLLGMYRSKMVENQEEEGIVPLAFRRVIAEAERKKVSFDKAKIEGSSKRSEAWFAANPYTRDVNFHYYYVYSKERYESFLEITKGKQTKSPDWYNEGVKMLQASQGADGSWGNKKDDASSFIPPNVATSFSLLFLIRSTQKAIGDLSEAMNQGIGEIPDDVGSIIISGNKIVNKNATNSIDDALKMLEDDSKMEGEDGLAPDRMLLASDPKQRKEQLNRFVRLLNAKDYKARQIAAKMLGRGDDLDLVPSLIYALTDPDPRVPFFAEQSLRIISRQLDTYHLPKRDKLTDQDKAKASLQWKRWYLSVRPDYVFVD